MATATAPSRRTSIRLRHVPMISAIAVIIVAAAGVVAVGVAAAASVTALCRKCAKEIVMSTRRTNIQVSYLYLASKHINNNKINKYYGHIKSNNNPFNVNFLLDKRDRRGNDRDSESSYRTNHDRDRRGGGGSGGGGGAGGASGGGGKLCSSRENDKRSGSDDRDRERDRDMRDLRDKRDRNSDRDRDLYKKDKYAGAFNLYSFFFIVFNT